MTHVLMPKRPGEVVDSAVINGIEMQTEQTFTYIMSSTPINTARENHAANMNALKCCASKPVAVYMDSDVVLLHENDIEAMRKHLEDHPEDGAVALNTKPRIIDSEHLMRKRESGGHVVAACFMVRSKVLEQIVFSADSEHCVCVALNRDLKAMNRPIVYLRGRSACELRDINKHHHLQEVVPRQC